MPRLPRLNLDRVQFVADYGINWRSREECLLLVKRAKQSGFHWVSFHLFDAEYLREVRGDALKATYHRLIPHVRGLAPLLSTAAHEARIGLCLTPLTSYVVEEAMRFGRGMRVPLERTGDQRYMMAWANAKGNALGMYETMATWPSANVGRMPLFVAPGHPAKAESYDPYWKAGNLRGRLGVAFHLADKDLFMRAAVVGSPMISVPVMPQDYAEAPDRAISVMDSEAAQWVAEVKAA